MGSTVSVLISYILPTAFYLRIKYTTFLKHSGGIDVSDMSIRDWVGKSSKTRVAMAVLVVGIGLFFLCTTMSIVEQVQGSKQPAKCK